MAVKFFLFPFGVDGDKTAIPDTTQVSGAVSYEEGFGFDYERDPVSDPLSKNIPRDETNQLYYDITNALQQYQTFGTPNFITTSDNGGVAYSYSKYARVLYDDGSGLAAYTSLANSNVALPTDVTKWQKGDAGITALTGDVIASGNGSVAATIADNAITTVKIAASNVTLDKIQNILANSILMNDMAIDGQPLAIVIGENQLVGRPTGGVVGPIGIGTGLNLSGAGLLTATTTVNPLQLAKALISFDGRSGGTVHFGYNIASMTRNAAGDYTIAFTTPFADGFYIVDGIAKRNSSGVLSDDANVKMANVSSNPAAGQIRIVTTDNSGNPFDMELVTLSFFGAQ